MKEGPINPDRQHPVPAPRAEDTVSGYGATASTPQPSALHRIPVGRILSLVRAPPVEHVEHRAGPITGARIVLLLTRKPMSPGAIATKLSMEESYIRRVCRALHQAGLLRCEEVEQRGTPPLKVYSIPDRDRPM